MVADSELGTKDGSGRSNSSAGFSTNKREKGLTERAVEGPERWSLLSNEYRSSAIMWNTMASKQGWIVFDSATARIVAFNKPRPNGW